MEFKKREVHRRSTDPKIHQKLSQETIDKIKRVEERAATRTRKNVSTATRGSSDKNKFKQREILRGPKITPKILKIFVKCDMWQVPHMNTLRRECPIPYIDHKIYDQERRILEMQYDIDNPSKGQEVMRYWNDSLMKFFDLTNSKLLSKKIRYETKDLMSSNSDCPTCGKGK